MSIPATMNAEPKTMETMEELPTINPGLRLQKLSEPMTRVRRVRHADSERHTKARPRLTVGLGSFRRMMARGLLGAELSGALAGRLGRNRCLFSLKCGRG
jgi:hypothetical protein